MPCREIVLNPAHHGRANELLLKIYLYLSTKTNFVVRAVLKAPGPHFTGWSLDVRGFADTSPRSGITVGVTTHAHHGTSPPWAFVQGPSGLIVKGLNLILTAIECVEFTPLQYEVHAHSFDKAEWRIGPYHGLLKGLFRIREGTAAFPLAPGPTFVHVVDHLAVQRVGNLDCRVQLL